MHFSGNINNVWCVAGWFRLRFEYVFRLLTIMDNHGSVGLEANDSRRCDLSQASPLMLSRTTLR
jgi:hypothetical protein